MSDPLSVIVKGPLTVDEIKAIIAVVATAERERPEQTFHVHIDSPEADDRMAEVCAWMQHRPLPPGYGRTFVQGDRR